MADRIHPIISKMIPLVENIAKTFGDNCEVVLHDFTDMHKSVVAIANGHVTGRELESSITELYPDKLFDGSMGEDMVNYTGKSKDGRVMKSTTTFIRDDDDKVIGCLCINFDMTELVAARKVLNDIMALDSDLVIEKDDVESENKVSAVLSQLVMGAVEEYGKPIIYMTKDEKVGVVKKLDSQGTFMIKGAIDYVAGVLCVSRYTIYNYLDEIR